MMNIVQQTAGSIGTAVMSVILTNQVQHSRSASAYSGVTQGQIPAAKFTAAQLADGRSSLAGAFGHTYLVALILIVLCLAPALFLPRRKIEKADQQAEDVAVPVAIH
jgi:hypothetical protein